MNPVHVLLVTEDSGLATGLVDALAEHAEMADVESVRRDDAGAWVSEAPDVVIVDGDRRWPPTTGAPPEELYPDALVLQLRDGSDTDAEGEVEGHLRSRQLGYVRRDDLEEVAPVIVALAGLSQAARKKAAG